MSEAQQLLDQVKGQIWSLLRALRNELAQAASLSSLSPMGGHEGTPLAGKLLGPMEDLALPNPTAAGVLSLLRAFVAPATTTGTAVRLHGWNEQEGRPRSIALCSSDPDRAADWFVAAVSTDEAGEVGVHVMASVAPALQVTTPGVGSNLTLTVRPGAAGVFDAWFGPAGARELAPAAACTIEGTITREGHGPFVIGPDAGPRVVAQRLSLTTRLGFGAPAPPALQLGLELSEVSIDVAPEWLSPLTGGSVRPTLKTLVIQADATNGLRFASGGTRVLLPAATSLGAVRIDGVAVDLASEGGSASSLRLRIGLTLQASPPGLPLSIGVDGAGADFPWRLGAGEAFGFDPSRIARVPARGIAAALTLPMASGGGALLQTGEHAFGGAFELNLGFVSVQAYALLQSEPGRGFSFVALLSVRFPYPGIQLGFGFSLNGVGGIVGINRRVDAPALEAAVLDGSVNQLLFPADPAGNAVQAIATLGRVFPFESGHFVVGPMLELAWGGRVLTLVVALVFDLPDPPSCSILGRLTLALPDPAAPAVFIQATFLGQFDPAIPATRFVGTLCGSHIVGLPLRGDILMLARGGSNAALVVSAGGFHPAFVRPPEVPTLRRIGVELSPLPLPRLRAEVYFAFTAGSVQFGAGIQMSATIAGCGVEGWFAIDALCQWSPVFSFIASCGGSVAVEVLGETLMAVSLGLTVQGPTPWRVRGTGSVTLLIEDISLDFEASWGEAPATPIAAPNVEKELRAAFRETAAWVADLSARDRSVAILKDGSGIAGNLLHPLSGVTARQRVLPFDVTIARYQGIPVIPQRWRLTGGGLRDGAEVPLGPAVSESFAVAQYLDLGDHEQLGGRAFDPMTCGAVLLADDVVIGPSQDAGADFETTLVVEPASPPLRFEGALSVILAAATTSLASVDAHAEASWWVPSVASGLTVAAAQPVGLAQGDSLSALALPPEQPVHSYAGAREMVHDLRTKERRSAQLVERWELA